MKTLFGARKRTQPAEDTRVEPSADPPNTRITRVAQTVRQAYLQVFGIPDYEHYAEHMATHHPGAPVLSRRAFCALAIERKYGGSGPRCC